MESTTAEARLGALHDRHAGPLLRFLVRLTRGERQTAEDVAQETMVRAWRHLDTVPDGIEGERRWLWTVARRVFYDVARSRRSRPDETPLHEFDNRLQVEDHAATVVAEITLRQSICSLTSEQREVLHELHVRGRSVRETADHLHLPTGTVKSRTHYALRTVRGDLQVQVAPRGNTRTPNPQEIHRGTA